MKWDRDKLLMELPKFSFRTKTKIKGEIAEYLSFYDTCFEKQFDHLDQRIGWVDTDDFRIVLQTFTPSNAKASVFLFHGYFDHAGLYKKLIYFLLKSGFAVVIYDMPGHGLSSGTAASIDNFQQYQHILDACLSVCKGQMVEPFHAVGQSTGGAVLLDCLMLSGSDKNPFNKVILLAPLIRPAGWKIISGMHTVLKPFLRIWYRSFSRNSNDEDFVKFVKERDPLQTKWLSITWVGALKNWVPKIESGKQLQRKILVIQGTEDKAVDWKHNISVLKHLFKELKIIYIDGARHHLVNESQEMRQTVFKAIVSELSG